MNTTAKESASIEEITVQSLDKSLDGLLALQTDSVACGQLMLADAASGLAEFKDLVENVRNFYVFENDIRSLFQIDGKSIRDSAGDLTNAEETLSCMMNDMVAKLDTQDIKNLAEILINGIPAALDRFLDLLPILRGHIQNEYLSATC